MPVILLTDPPMAVTGNKTRPMPIKPPLQKEMNKIMSSLDKLWGLVGDAGVVAGKFGKDAKPMIERIREITQIVWSVQARAEELPSNTMLPQLTDNKSSTD